MSANLSNFVSKSFKNWPLKKDLLKCDAAKRESQEIPWVGKYKISVHKFESWIAIENAIVYQFAWTSRCQPRRVLNSSERRIIAREATWLVEVETRQQSNFDDDNIDCNNDGDDGNNDEYNLITIGEELRPSPSMRTTSFPCCTRSATSRANLLIVRII